MSEPTDSLDPKLQDLQQRLLETARRHFGAKEITPAIEDAFLKTPRHLFIPRFLSHQTGRWTEVNDRTLHAHLDYLYADHAICIHRNKNGQVDSTISQPSLVLFMLSLLDLKPGQTVFELGGGSGWNAAMIGRLVGPQGRVFSLEIIPDLVEKARQAIATLGLSQVQMLDRDGSQGLPEKAPFDRAVFTAAASYLPAPFFQQIREDGLLLFVMKLDAQQDLLATLRKRGSRFHSEYHMTCSFVPVTGKEGQDREAISNIDSERWRRLARPDPEDLLLSIAPASETIEPQPDQWIIPRKDCQFIWQAPPHPQKP